MIDDKYRMITIFFNKKGSDNEPLDIESAN